MLQTLTRRAMLAAGAAIIALGMTGAASAQDKVQLRFSAVFSDQDIRAEMMQKFADAIGDEFDFQGYYGGTLFRQGTELVALQRDELGALAEQRAAVIALEIELVADRIGELLHHFGADVLVGEHGREAQLHLVLSGCGTGHAERDDGGAGGEHGTPGQCLKHGQPPLKVSGYRTGSGYPSAGVMPLDTIQINR